VDNSGKEWWQSGTTPITISSNGGAITVASPSSVTGASLYRIYAGPSAGSMQMQSTVALGTNYTITPMSTSSSPPSSASPGLNPYYRLSIYNNNPVDMFFTDGTPVPCSSNCSNSGDVTLGASSSSSNYPPASATLDAGGRPLDVVTNWVNSLSNISIADGMGGTGNYTVTAKLLDYHTVNNAFFGVVATGCSDPMASLGICRQPYEVWQITSTGTWNNNIGAGAANPTVVMRTTIAPLYLSYFGNALYGLCRVALSGGVCTDSYNSNAGTYGGASTGTCATASTTTGTNDSANGADVGSNGGITLNGTVTVGGNVSFADATGNSNCDIGFNGNDSGVAGSVLPGPSVPAPTPPNMTAWGYAWNGSTGYYNSSAPPVAPPKNYVMNVYTGMTSVPTLPPGVSCTAGASGYLVTYSYSIAGGSPPHAITYSNISCTSLTGTGGGNSPYRLGAIDASAASTGQPATVNIIGPANGLGGPTYIAANSINTGNAGTINFSYQAPSTPATDTGLPATWPQSPPNQTSAFVVDVGDSVSVGGTATFNCGGATCTGVPSPDFLRLNVLGNEGAGASGTCSGGSTAVDLGGQGQLTAIITAPNGAVRLAGSGSGGVFFGSILGSNVLDCGNYAVHFDINSRLESGKLYNSRTVSVTRPQM
jgi:hypothetical protein